MYHSGVPAPPSLSRRRWLLAIVLTVAGISALALADRWLLRLRSRWISTTHGAAWIWEARNPHDLTPTAFYAVRDFELAAPPARARLLLQADEEYVLTLNAKRLGAGRYLAGAPLDTYDVTPWLLPGTNRLLVELRSGRGAGGFLLALLDGDGRPLVVSGPEFRLFKRHQLGLPRAFLPVAGGDPAFVWGMPPLGRWGRPVAGHPAPVLPARWAGAPIAAAGRQEGPLTVRFDWGREVTGFLELELPPRAVGDDPAAREVGLLWSGTTPPALAIDPPGVPVLPVADAHAWLAPAPRRLRYALVAGLPATRHGAPLVARIYPVDPAAVPAADARPRGVLGIEPPPLRTPVEDEVRRKLKRVAGVALGEKS